MTLIAPIKLKVEPKFVTYDLLTPFLGERNVGDTFKAIVSFQIIEKTKSFTRLKITNIHITNTKRKF